jgi:hypothetical protein
MLLWIFCNWYFTGTHIMLKGFLFLELPEGSTVVAVSSSISDTMNLIL